MLPNDAEQKITDTFYALLQQKPLSAIKASDIIRLAEINRSTFYRHYASIEELYESECIALFRTIFSDIENTKCNNILSFWELLKNVHTRFAAYENLLSVLTRATGSPVFFHLLYTYLHDTLSETANRNALTSPETECGINGTCMFCVIYVYSRFAAVQTEDREREWDIPAFRISKRDVQGDVCRLLSLFRGGTPETHDILLTAHLKIYGEKKHKYTSVTELLQTAGISRTVFYQYYKNMDDFLCTLETAASFVVKKYLSVIAHLPTVTITPFFRLVARFRSGYEKNAVSVWQKSEDILPFFIRTLTLFRDELRTDVAKKQGEDFAGKNMEYMDFFILDEIHIIMLCLADGDSVQLNALLRDFLERKKNLGL